MISWVQPHDAAYTQEVVLLNPHGRRFESCLRNQKLPGIHYEYRDFSNFFADFEMGQSWKVQL